MSRRELNEILQPFRDAQGEGAIVFDTEACGQTPTADWFCPSRWGAAAQPIDQGGRGAAWFVDSDCGSLVLRHYLRGGLVAKLSRDTFLWRGTDKVRSFAEFRLLQRLLALGLPVPRPFAALYRRHGLGYRAAILLQRLAGVQTFAHLVAHQGNAAPWQAAGRLIAHFHRAGLNHADLNAYNLLFGPHRKVVLGEALDIAVGGQHLRVVQRPALGHDEHQIEHLEGIDESQHQHRQDGRL